MFDSNGKRVFFAGMQREVHRQGPCLSEVTYRGKLGKGLRHQAGVSLSRSDDITRGIYRIRLDVEQPTEFSRLVFFQVGADTYNTSAEKKMAIGNEGGLTREWNAEWGGDVYRGDAMMLSGEVPWVSMHEAERPANQSKGAWANRGFVLRKWRARLGGKEAAPWVAERGTGGRNTSSMDLVPPPSIKRLLPGDFVEATIEHLVLPQHADDYYGPNTALRFALAKLGNTWRMVEREAVQGHRTVDVKVGTLVRRSPDIRMATEKDTAECVLNGGLGYVPVTFTGLTRPDNFSLKVNGEVLDQSMHGNDFWQTDFDPTTLTWSQTYNVQAQPGKPMHLRFEPSAQD